MGSDFKDLSTRFWFAYVYSSTINLTNARVLRTRNSKYSNHLRESFKSHLRHGMHCCHGVTLDYSSFRVFSHTRRLVSGNLNFDECLYLGDGLE